MFAATEPVRGPPYRRPEYCTAHTRSGGSHARGDLQRTLNRPQPAELTTGVAEIRRQVKEDLLPRGLREVSEPPYYRNPVTAFQHYIAMVILSTLAAFLAVLVTFIPPVSRAVSGVVIRARGEVPEWNARPQPGPTRIGVAGADV